MKKLEYTIEEKLDGIFAVKVPDHYDRAMLFMRVQEYYESPNKRFRGKDFDFFDYMRWYANTRGSFSYAADWAGFNFPFKVAQKCYERFKTQAPQTPYDLQMLDILYLVGALLHEKGQRDGYIIGIGKDVSELRHEMAHALFYTNDSYRKEMKALAKALPEKIREKLSAALKRMGYCKAVEVDEIQAYCATELADEMDKIKVDVGPFEETFKRYYHEPKKDL